MQEIQPARHHKKQDTSHTIIQPTGQGQRTEKYCTRRKKEGERKANKDLRKKQVKVKRQLNLKEKGKKEWGGGGGWVYSPLGRGKEHKNTVNEERKKEEGRRIRTLEKASER
jgi:hypothetical protein